MYCFTIIWPVLVMTAHHDSKIWLCLTIVWPWFDYRSTIVWLSFDYHLTIVWLSFDYRLTIVWLSFDHRLSIVWLSFDYRATIVWPSSDDCRLSIVRPVVQYCVTVVFSRLASVWLLWLPWLSGECRDCHLTILLVFCRAALAWPSFDCCLVIVCWYFDYYVPAVGYLI